MSKGYYHFWGLSRALSCRDRAIRYIRLPVQRHCYLWFLALSVCRALPFGTPTVWM